MELDRDRLIDLCHVVDEAEDDARPMAMMDLVAYVRENPESALQLALEVLREVDADELTFVTDFASLIQALRQIDERWLDRTLQLLPAEPSLLDGVEWALRGTNELHLVVDRLGLDLLSRTWFTHYAADVADHNAPTWWASSFVMDLDNWADEDRHRSVLLRLIEDADGQSLWDVAAGPLEDFITSDEDRLQWMEYQAAHNPKFKAALAGVWTYGKDPATAARVAAIAPAESV
jgi:hypothetical protein